MAGGKPGGFLAAELTSDTNIPLELLIARLQDTNTTLLKVVPTSQAAEVAFGVMEVGSDGIILQSEDLGEIAAVDKLMSREELGKVELLKAKVVDVQHIGMGYRACIDSTTIMKQNEGMLVGSTANGGLLLSSETHFLPYMELRPFRVNAGAVHSYVWAPGDKTAYITELRGGKKVLCVDTEGNTREITVGRVKIEIRPLLKIEVEAQGVRINAMVQDDWHIRIFGGDGTPRNASAIRLEDDLLAYISGGARHVGIKIDEMLEEK
jgi:3-amino-4-hydroxybenzoic acid synthase